MSNEGETYSLVEWIVQGGVITAVVTWLGVQQKQMNDLQTHSETTRGNDRRAQNEEIERVRARVILNAEAIADLRQRAVTKEDLDHVAERLEDYMRQGFGDVRKEINETHRRVDNVMVGGRRETDPPAGDNQ